MRLIALIIISYSFSAHASWKKYDFPLSKNIEKSYMKYIKAGKSLFAKPWVEAPSSTLRRDGLGPLFNATSCASCHPNNSRGIPTMKNGRIHPSLLFRVKNIETKEIHPIYAGQLQINALPGLKPEVKISVSYKSEVFTYPDGKKVTLKSPTYTFTDFSLGTINENYYYSPRLAPHLGGMGIIDKVSVKDIETYAKSVNGKVANRFGLQGESETLEKQVAGAFKNDMGITSHLEPNESCTEYQVDCFLKDKHQELEIRDDHFKYVTDFVSHIIVPQKENTEPKGKEVFNKIGCNTCHANPYKTVDGQKVKAYSDLLVHDMGDDLADRDFKNTPVRTYWRTAPLWGLSRLRQINLLHDGRAKSIEEAILWHGGEAQKVKNKFINLEKEKRQALINFVKSL